MLKDQQIKNAKPANKPYTMLDERGLFLVVTPNGGKLWRWRYRFGGKPKIISYGQYPNLSLAAAREFHHQAKTLLANGTDPMAQKKAVKEERRQQEAAKEHSFQAVSKMWLEYWGKGKSKQHVDATRRRLESNVWPLLGARPVGEIEPTEIVRMVRTIEARGVGDLAKRAFQTTGQIFRYAAVEGITNNNPVSTLRPRDALQPTTKTNVARVEPVELPALLRDIEVYRGEQITRLGLKLLALTIVRTGELRNAPWAEFDFTAKRWTIPAWRMKMPSPHVVPLSAPAIEVLELLHTLTGDSNLLFPNEQDPSQTMTNNTMLYALYRMGYKGRMTGHGFRGVASTILHEQGYKHEHVELQLAHMKRDAVSAAYDYAKYLRSRTAMMEDWGIYLEQLRRTGKPFPLKPSRAYMLATQQDDLLLMDDQFTEDAPNPAVQYRLQ